MFCGKCGSRIENGSFCPNCGHPVNNSYQPIQTTNVNNDYYQKSNNKDSSDLCGIISILIPIISTIIYIIAYNINHENIFDIKIYFVLFFMHISGIILGVLGKKWKRVIGVILNVICLFAIIFYYFWIVFFFGKLIGH